MDCIIELKTLRSLRKLVGNDDTLFSSCYSEAVGSNNQPTKAFAKWYAERHNGEVVNLNANSSINVAKEILNYHYFLHPNGNATVRNNTSTEVITFGYTDIVSRNFAKRYFANQILVAASNDEVRNISDKKSHKELVINKAKNNVKANLVDRIAKIKNISREEAIVEFKKGIKNLDEIFNSDEVTTQDKNLYALFNEIIARSRVDGNTDKTLSKKFFDEVLRDNRLISFNFPKEVNDEVHEEEAADEEDTNNKDKVGEEEVENYKDESISNTEHSGIYSSFKKHIGDKLNLYLNTIPKLTSAVGTKTNRKNDTSNPLGVQDFHSSNELFSILYSGDVDYTNITTMANSIKTIAERNSEYSGLIKLYEDIVSDFNLACELYSTFSKIVITKQEVLFDGDIAKLFSNNRNIDKDVCVRFEVLNGVRNNIINADVDYLSNKIVGLTADVQALYVKKGTTVVARSESREYALIDDIATTIQGFVPTIDKTAIENFIKNNKGKGNEKANILELITSIKSLVNEIEDNKIEYISKQSAIKEANSINRLLDKSKVKDTANRQHIWDMYSDGEYPRPEHYRDVDAIREKDFLTGRTITLCNDLANKLTPYTTINTELNSYNVHGNQSSNVINSSWITNLIKIFENKEALINYGKLMFQSSQYKFSNILVEKKDENGKIINKGLFREVNGQFVPTEYASRLIKIKLFDGASNDSTDTSAVYSEMSNADYITTAYHQFFNNTDSEPLVGKDVEFADFFLRTPSDASRNFIITLPRYNSKNLFIVKDEKSYKDIIDKKLEEIPTIPTDEQGFYVSLNEHTVNKQQAINDITAKHLGDKLITLSDINDEAKQATNGKLNKGDRITVTYKYKNKNNETVSYVLEGTYGDTKNGKIVFEKPVLKGILTQDETGNKQLTNDLLESITEKYKQKALKSGEIQMTINRNHPIYKQYKATFMQELLNAKVAFDKIFEEDGEGDFRNKLDPEQCFANYHTKGGNLYIVSDGRKVLVGNVFRSDKFRLNGKNYLGELFAHADNSGKSTEPVFDFFYGGATKAVIADAATGEIQLNKEQNEAVDNALSSYIQDFIYDNINKMSEYESIIKGTELNNDNIIEFAINYNLAYMGFDDLFEGDMKFYISTQDALKRAKEVQGSGVPYGIYDLTKDYTKTSKTEIVESPLITPFKKIDSNGNETNHFIRQYDGFYGVTIKNTIRIQEEVKPDGVVAQRLATQYEKAGLSKEEAIAKANAFLDGYKNTKVNDAQSYITFDEWVRRITARGQFKKYESIIGKILDESKELTPKDIDQFIQVQKNFYYDLHYNEELGVIAPRQIKNAEFVLVPRFIKGTQLELVAKLMDKFGIDQLNTVETSKAGKANILTLWDNDGEIDNNIIEDLDKDSGFESDFCKRVRGQEVRQLFDYNHLYTQQETPQHINAENKAAIQIMKKIIDNVDEKSHLYPIKKEFMTLYSANIEDSYIELMQDCGVELNSDGSIKLDDNGFPIGLNYEIFFEKLQAEAERQALDSNMLDFLTLSEEQVIGTTPITRMPLIMSNVSTKLESIAQSMFNNSVTRQKLPGFHAAQITNVGFKAISEQVKSYAYSSTLRYHSDENGNYVDYVEIMLPASNFGFKRTKEDGSLKSDKELLDELKAEGLDEIIGYRIPTEGKQSVCKFKVVGFTDDALGSTIVVPDAWVSQTGSDFDIDSVYGIQYNTKLDKKGVIRKIKYSENPLENYIKYVYRNVHHRIENKVYADKDIKIKEAKARIDDTYKKTKDALNDKESEIYHSLPDAVREALKTYDAEYKKEYGEASNKDEYKTQLLSRVRFINEDLIPNLTNKEVISGLKDFIDVSLEIVDSIDNAGNNLFEEKGKAIEDILNTLKEEYLKVYEQAAKDAGLMSFEEFSNLSTVKQNGNAARKNKMLDDMKVILGDDSSLEENLSRSNFDDLIDARNEIYNGTSAQINRANRTSYSFLDQAAYQDDAMSGAKLKAFSVTRDTFCSICNTVKPNISKSGEFKIVIDAKDYNFKDVLDSFGDNAEYDSKTETITLTINRFGWSLNNKNIAGKILTAYSSQTTAHILDAIKEGAIPNENDYTFAVFKTFPDVGLDYKSAVSFIMQPGVTRIVNAYNANKSIYVSGNFNPIHSAIKSIAKDLGLSVKDKTPINEVIDIINESDEIKDILKGVFDISDAISIEPKFIESMPLNIKHLKDRIKKAGIFSNSTPVKEGSDSKTSLVYDLLTVLQFNKLNLLAQNISDIARVCNPDKFGAKQSIFATNKVFDDINTLITKDNTVGNGILLKVNGDNILESIYPGISSGLEHYVYNTDSRKESSYPTLNAFLRYSTAPSIILNRSLFDTQSLEFRNAVNRLVKNFSGTNKVITEKIFNDYKNYILGYMYTNVSTIKHVLDYTKDFGLQSVVYDNPSIDYIGNERQRIFGYNRSTNSFVIDSNGREIPFEVVDANNPTEEEVKQFLTLSPAQKVIWIQKRFSDGLVTKYLRANTHNTYKNNIGKHTINFIENSDDIELVYDSFEKTLNNENPLLAATAIDIIKYAFVVDGFKMRKGGVSKVIKNSTLFNVKEVDGSIKSGIDFTSELKAQFRNFGSIFENKTLDNIEERFLRSNPDITSIPTKTIKRDSNNKSELGFSYYGMYKIDGNNKDILEDYNIVTDNIANRYIRLKVGYNKEAVLYRIYKHTSGDYFLIPLNKLELNEQEDVSANNANNKYPNKQFYWEAIKDFTGSSDVLWGSKWSEEFEDRLNKNTGLSPANYINKKTKANTKANEEFDLNKPNSNEVGAFNKVITDINNWFGINNGVDGKELWISNLALSRYIKSSNINTTARQIVPIQTIFGGKNGQIQYKAFNIRKAAFNQYAKYLKYDNANDDLSLVKNVSKRNILKNIQDTVKSNGKDLADYPIFIVTEEKDYNTESIRFSALDEEAAQQGVQAFDFAAKAGFEAGVKAKAQFKELTGTTNPNAAKENIAGTVRITAEFIDNTVTQILHDFEYFTKNTETGDNLSIDSPQLINVIAKDVDERDRFLKTILTAKALLNKFNEYQNVNIASEDKALEHYLKTIQNKINELATDGRLDRAFKNFANNYLTKLSDNPLFTQDLLTVFDGYTSTGLVEAWINDLQESANPIVQIVTKTVMENVRRDDMVTKERIREFVKFRNEIEKEAKSKGLTIDMDKIIDINGRLRQPFTDELRTEFVNLITEMQSLKAQGDEKHIEYLLAKHKLDAFKLKHFEQPIIDEYYKKKLDIEERMLQDGIGKIGIHFEGDPFEPTAVDPMTIGIKKETDPRYIGHRYIFSYYKKLKNRQWELRSHIDSEGNLADAWATELKNIEDELKRLMYGDDRVADDVYEDFAGGIPDKDKNLEAYKRYLLYGGAHRAALQSYIKDMQSLNNEYYKHDAVYGFEEELERHLDTIRNYEKRNSSGELIVPIKELMKHEDYVKAKTWVANNARFVYGEGLWEDIENALGLLGANRSDKVYNIAKNIIRDVAKKTNAYDNKGVVDASKFSDDDIKRIKAEQQRYYNYVQNAGLSDAKLIKNGTRGDVVYTSEFYKGMTSDGNINKEYNEIVAEINSILQKVYNPHTKTVRTDSLSSVDLRKLASLYSKLGDIAKKSDSTNGKEVFKFINENVDFTFDTDKFEMLNSWAKEKAETLGEDWYKAWYETNTEVKYENGEIALNETGEPIIQPNSRLYGIIKPKDKVKDKFTDVGRTKGLKTLKELLITEPTEHYYRTYQEKLAQGKEVFDKWYEENHIYDPYKQTVVPLQCWTVTKPNPNNDGNPYYNGTWVPTFRNRETTIKDGRDESGNLDGSRDVRNPKYKEGGLYNNYKRGSGFDSDVELNEAELKIRTMFSDTLQALCKTESSKAYIRDGKMPSERKAKDSSTKSLLKESAKFIGYVEPKTGDEDFYNDSDITFANDRTMDMPMLHLLEDKNGAKFDEKEPNIEDYGGDIDRYNKDIEEYNKRKVAFKEAKQKEHNDAINRDWWSVMEHFIESAGHFNSVQEQKLLLYYGEEMLKDYKVYQQKLGSGHLTTSNNDNSGYERDTDKYIHAQYVNWCRRLMYNQFKDKNRGYTKGAAFWQNFTSNVYMMLNVKGGIANVLMGETQILGEQFAKEYFDSKDWLKGKHYWATNSLSFVHGMYKDTSISTADAIVKYFQIIDYDEITGQVKVANAEEAVQRLRDLMFSPQAIGEHFMQNGAMFSMMYSHRLFDNPKYGVIAGEPKYVSKNLAEYTRELSDNEFKKLLDDEHKRKFEELRKAETETADSKKEYARFRKDLVSEFAIRYLTKEERKTWRTNYNNAVKQAKEEFDNDELHPTLISQFNLASDGKLGFVDGSFLSTMSLEERSLLLGRFKGRVISVNKKIHGNYGKLDQAQLEKWWLGSLVMQYHKHIVPGFMKHFRRQGYHNEERGTIEKGCYVSLYDYLSLNMRAVKTKNGMSDAQITTLESIQNIFKYTLDFCLEAKATYHILPEREKANIRRSLAELAGILGAIAISVAARFILDDDEDSFIGNLALYEGDRLATEAAQFNPYGIWAQGKQLWSQPIAAMGIANDLIAATGQISKMLIEGEDFDPTYSSGRFAGQNKLSVYVKRRIPIYRQYDNLMHISDDNRYYKLSQNASSLSQPIYDALTK